MTPTDSHPRDSAADATPLVETGAHPRRVLVYWHGGSTAFDLPRQGSITVGRSRDCEIRIDHPSVSRKHAVLHVRDGIEVEDLGSSNGTRVSGQRLARGGRVALPRGALLEVGLATLIVQGSEGIEAAGADPSQASAAAGREPTVDRLYRLVDMVASSRINVILAGEKGVGKGVTAEAIHARSRRAGMPLIRIACGAMPEPLLDAELFGTVESSLTGAARAKAGLLETANGGTLLLDEVDELPLGTQAKLLRALEDASISRGGSRAPIPIDVRVLCTTSRDLEGRVAAGAFRLDLYYRLNGITIRVPPGRHRRMESTGRASAAAPRPAAPAPPPGNLRTDIEALERRRILEALERCGGNQTRAAKMLGMSRRTLLVRLDAYGFPRPRKGGAD